MIRLNEIEKFYLRSKPHPNEPIWMQSFRKEAFERFKKTGFPGSKDEHWKYTPLHALLRNEFSEAVQSTLTLTPEMVNQHSVTEGDKLVFVNGVFVSDFSKVTTSTVQPFSKAIRDQENLLYSHFDRILKKQTNPFENLNMALFKEGALIFLSREHCAASPIQLIYIHTAAQPSLYFVRNIILLGEESEGSCIETYINLQPNQHASAYFTHAATSILLEKKAKLNYIKQQQEGRQSFHFHTVSAEQKRESIFSTFTADLGSNLTRNDLRISLTEEKARVECYGFYLARNHQHIDNHTWIGHEAPETESIEYYKGIAGDQAHAVFNGKIYIALHAEKSKAAQQNKNILLTSTAEIDTKPELEIYTDDVSCTHGAAIGELSEEALFYLRARGIDLSEAERLLLNAFADEILEKIKNKKVYEVIKLSLNQGPE